MEQGNLLGDDFDPAIRQPGYRQSFAELLDGRTPFGIFDLT
jgi:hypothetical protein